ncbi:dihydrofolate reductase [Alkalihalophilus pseudofirmus]|uniref:dihydrofolate reductase n=1 Tax=Alkalihalophilus pseudofirmus TaxID=79885 RepID=UPI00259BD325|nr:dihydrofolate reductase [Alkalihalophilus pseudofirmus]WEG18678.1 dihydrofolate reductase [Alkalihalophilus pseudofirmus]
MALKIIAAIGLNSELGRNNKLLVKQKEDLSRFEKLTTGHLLIMGRETHESILRYRGGAPLDNRKHIVLTGNPDYQSTHEDVYIYSSVKDVLHDYKEYGEDEDVWVCGGAQIYNQFLPYVDEIYLTTFHKVFPDADTFFPQFEISEWDIISNESFGKDENNQYDYNFVTYKRKQ